MFHTKRRWIVPTMPPLPGRLLACVLAALAVLITGCAGNQRDQPRMDPLQYTQFFPDNSSARPLVADTYDRGALPQNTLLMTGKENGKDATMFPFQVTRDVIQRGQTQFDIYCLPCHGALGYGDGVIVRRGYSHPPSYHIDRLRNAPVGHFFDVMTNGYGAMPSYAGQVTPIDRWAIIAYIRALQYSQHADVNKLPPNVRQQLQGGQR